MFYQITAKDERNKRQSSDKLLHCFTKHYQHNYSCWENVMQYSYIIQNAENRLNVPCGKPELIEIFFLSQCFQYLCPHWHFTKKINKKWRTAWWMIVFYQICQWWKKEKLIFIFLKTFLKTYWSHQNVMKWLYHIISSHFPI